MVIRPPRTAGPEAFKTFAISAPVATHWRPATCAEVGCEAHEHGWRTTCDLTTEIGVRQARYIRDHAGRAYTYAWAADRLSVTFTFPAGQVCFAEHKAPVDRPALFVARNGDHRGSGRRAADRRVYDRPDQWQYDFAQHQDQLAELQRRG